MSAPLHVAVDTTNLKQDWRGITRYVRAIFPRLSARPDVRLTMVGPGWFGYRVPRGADVIWHPANGTFFESRAPSVVTFHDAVPFRFAAEDPKRRESQQQPWLRSAETARAFLVNSQFTASEVTTFLGIDAARQTVTPLAVEDDIFSPAGSQAKLPGGAPFVLFVGTGEAVKNIDTLLEAHARAFPANEVKLAVAGSAPPKRSRATWLGVLDAPTLASWYRGAMLVAVPSVYEGFGLPLLEALACGRAVIASRVGALPEVGGNACGWIDDPRDVDAWASALRQLVADEPVRRELERAAVERAALFSWDRCAARTFSVLQAAAQQR